LLFDDSHDLLLGFGFRYTRLSFRGRDQSGIFLNNFWLSIWASEAGLILG
jgi:hypothetical protein